MRFFIYYKLTHLFKEKEKFNLEKFKLVLNDYKQYRFYQWYGNICLSSFQQTFNKNSLF